MIRLVFLIFAANLWTATANPFPVEQGSFSLFDPDPDPQPGFLTDSLFDESSLGDIGFSPQAEEQGDKSNLFGLLSNSITADNLAEELLASSNLDESALALDGSSCGTRSSSDTLFPDPELALDLVELDSLDARGFFEDVDQLQKEVIDPPDDGSCAAPNLLNSQERPSRPGVMRSHRELGQDSFPEIGEEVSIYYPVKDFGKCPVLQPDYTEALCCTGERYGIYVLKCAPGMKSAALLPPSCHSKPYHLLSPEADLCIAFVSFFCGNAINQYCCKTYNSYVSYPAESRSHGIDFCG